MLKMKFILTIFILSAVVTTQAQINPVTILNGFLYVINFFKWLVESSILTACYLTDTSQASVKGALLSVLVNSGNPNVTKCVLGCTATAIYTTESFFKNFTGIDPFGFLANIIGKEIYNDIETCLNQNSNWKCAYFLGYTTCIVPKVTPIIESEVGQVVKRMGVLLGAILKRSIEDLKNSLGTIIPGSKPLFQSVENYLIYLHILSPLTQPQRALGDISNSSVPLFVPIQSAINGLAGFLFPNVSVVTPLNAIATQESTTTTTSRRRRRSTTTSPTTTTTNPTTTTTNPTTTTTKATTPAIQSNVNPISNFFQMPGKIVSGIESWFQRFG